MVGAHKGLREAEMGTARVFACGDGKVQLGIAAWLGLPTSAM
jgi:hypothetical protein